MAETKAGTNDGFVMYFISFYFTVIIMMNLLIAIITERYQIVLEQTVPMECIERCVLMIEIEGFVNFLNKFISNNQGGGAKYYYHFARYFQDSE